MLTLTEGEARRRQHDSVHRERLDDARDRARRRGDTSDVNSAKTISYVAIGIGAVGLILALGAFALGRGPRKPAAG